MSHGGKREGSGRKPADDPRQTLPYRLRASVISKALELGRETVERLIEREHKAMRDEICDEMESRETNQ